MDETNGVERIGPKLAAGLGQAPLVGAAQMDQNGRLDR
jgi:hypothetical protein